LWGLCTYSRSDEFLLILAITHQKCAKGTLGWLPAEICASRRQ
jgi:hypothetical protein